MNTIHQKSRSYTLVILAFCNVLISSLLINNVLYAKGDLSHIDHIKLTNPALRFIDGIPFGVDAKAIQNMLSIRQKIRKMQYGIYNKKKKKYIGHYTLNGKNHTLKSLVAIEKEYESDFCRKKTELYKNHLNTRTFRYAWTLHEEKLEKELEEKLFEQEALSIRRHSNDEQQLLEAKKLKRKVKREYTSRLKKEREKIQREHMINVQEYDKKLQTFQNEHTKKMALLQSLLKDIKKELMIITGPFLEQARSAKEFLLPLMEEWAEKVGRPFSPLLRWHEENDGTEREIFEQDANSLERVDRFCTDLVDFNESIVYSCPRAYKQFMKLLSGLKQSI